MSMNRSLIKPGLDTPFHIDFTWWQDNDRSWQVYLRSLLCEEHQKVFEDLPEDELLDIVDPVTAEVRSVNGVQHVLMSHCARQPDFLSSQTSLVESIFRLFLANGNQPMSANELSQALGRPAHTILRTISGARIYRGIRPCCQS